MNEGNIFKVNVQAKIKTQNYRPKNQTTELIRQPSVIPPGSRVRVFD